MGELTSCQPLFVREPASILHWTVDPAITPIVIEAELSEYLVLRVQPEMVCDQVAGFFDAVQATGGRLEQLDMPLQKSDVRLAGVPVGDLVEEGPLPVHVPRVAVVELVVLLDHQRSAVKVGA